MNSSASARPLQAANLDFKNANRIAEVFVSNEYPRGYWEDQGYNWFRAARCRRHHCPLRFFGGESAQQCGGRPPS